MKQALVQFSHRLYEKGYVANHDGNISVRDGNQLWATPTAQSKGDITEAMLVQSDLEGKKISGTHNLFSEINLHVAGFKAREDIRVVIHAHPPQATALACAGIPLHPIFIAEALVTLGKVIPLVPFIPPGCPDTQKILAPYLQQSNVLMLQNHGVLAVGTTVEQTYYRLELVEHLATIQLAAEKLGGVKPLPERTVEKLYEKHLKANLAPPQAVIPWLASRGLADRRNRNRRTSTTTPAPPDETLHKIITEELRTLLR